MAAAAAAGEPGDGHPGALHRRAIISDIVGDDAEAGWQTMTLGLLVLLALAVFVGWAFNTLVRDRNQVHAAWSDVDVQLQRRHDLVPPLVASVRAYAAHESGLLERIAAERSSARRVPGVAARGEAETALGATLTHLIGLSEAYPELKADRNFAQLSGKLTDIEDALQHARRFYNGSVRQYNTDLQRFPTLFVARAFAFAPAEFFAADEDAKVSPRVAVD